MTDLAIVTFDFYPQLGGVQAYLFQISKRLSSNFSITVITPVPGEMPPRTNLTKKKPIGNHVFAYWRALSELKPEQVLVGHSHPQLLLAAWLYSRQGYAALAYGNDFLAGQQKWHRIIFNGLMARSHPLITITEANARRLQTLGLPKSRIVYPGTDPERFTPQTNKKPGKTPILLTVSRLVPRKGIDQVIEVMPRLVTEFPGLQYRIVGSGPDRERLQSLAEKKKLASSVHFLGKVSDEQLPEIYRQSDIFVMPSREIVATGSVEGFGIVYLEASASGIPVVAGRSGGAVEAVIDAETGFLVSPTDHVELTRILRLLLADEKLRRQLGANGRSWVEKEMNWDRAARQMQEVLAL